MNDVAEKLRNAEVKVKAMEESYQSLLSRLEVTALEVLRGVMGYSSLKSYMGTDDITAYLRITTSIL